MDPLNEMYCTALYGAKLNCTKLHCTELIHLWHRICNRRNVDDYKNKIWCLFNKQCKEFNLGKSGEDSQHIDGTGRLNKTARFGNLIISILSWLSWI